MDISVYTLRTWGIDQTGRYLDGLEACCRQLADHPEIGRQCEHVRPGLRRREHGRHVIFYRVEGAGILISRILHERMMPERQNIDEERQESEPYGDE